jgi:hypothetical protein
MFLTPWTLENYLADLVEPSFRPTVINSLIETIAATTIVVALRRINSSLGHMTPYECLARVKVTQHDG